MSDLKKLYVSTPIYYVNDAPHIGHAYTTILADVIVRFHKLLGYETYFLTGTDEHGQKVQQAAAKRGVSEQQHVDEYNVRFKQLWQTLGIEHDRFIRTTDADHKAVVQRFLQKLFDEGEIYSQKYGGWYSVGEERFFTEDELIDGGEGRKLDPVSKRPVEWVEEQNWFFRMGKYRDQLVAHIEAHPDFIVPDFRRNEVLGFLRQELNDLCISRPKSRLAWGIELPFDTDYVTYVWFDALTNYFSGVEGLTWSDGSALWPASYHLIGKDILTTHAVYWTTMLLALKLPLPQHILAHGWWLNGGAKMSKSSGTAINPIPYVEKYGVDSFRYFVIRDMTLGHDASFTDESFFKRLNSDLANDLGNGLNRVTRLVSSNFGGTMPSEAQFGTSDMELQAVGEACLRNAMELIPQLKLSQALEEVFVLVRAVNRYLEEQAPWKLAKDPAQRARLAGVLRTAAEAMRLSLQLLQPVVPAKAEAGLQQIGSKHLGLAGLRWGVLQGGETMGAAEPLFPRIDVAAEFAAAGAGADAGSSGAASGKAGTAGAGAAGPAQKSDSAKPTTSLGILQALELKVARIAEVAAHPDADSLYVLRVEDGSSDASGAALSRTVCAGLRRSYTPEELQDRKVVLFANLKPAKLRGIESAGMLLAADGPEGKALLLAPGEAPVGERLKWGEAAGTDSILLTLKDFDKISLAISGGAVRCEGLALQSSTGSIGAPGAAEGAGVH